MLTLDNAIDLAMELPIEKRLSLLEIVKKRTIDDIRSKIADDAAESRQAFYDGKLSVGSVDDLIKEIRGER